MARNIYTAVVDGVTRLLASQINPVYVELAKIALSTPHLDFKASVTATGTITLTDASEPFQLIDCNGADRVITLPAAGLLNHPFIIVNKTANTWALSVRTSGLVAVVTLKPQGTSVFYSDGTRWYASSGVQLTWARINAFSLTLTNGTSADSIAGMAQQGDGSFYAVAEAASTPGINLTVGFVSVSNFNWVNIIGTYVGATTHAVAIQLYNWAAARWDTFDTMQSGLANTTTASGYILENHSFFVANPAAYIGTSANAGKVNVRFYHTDSGNAAHDLYLDLVELLA